MHSSFLRMASANSHGTFVWVENGSLTPDGDSSVLGPGEWTAGKLFVLISVIVHVGPAPAILGGPTF